MELSAPDHVGLVVGELGFKVDDVDAAYAELSVHGAWCDLSAPR